METVQRTMERRSGVALWRQIADQHPHRYRSGRLRRRARCRRRSSWRSASASTATRCASAIAALVQEGVLRAEQGRGTFIAARKRFAYPIGARTRFSTGLEGQIRERRSSCSSTRRSPPRRASPRPCILPRARRAEDGNAERGGRPAAVARHLMAGRHTFRRLRSAFVETRSVTAAFRASASTTISGARPSCRPAMPIRRPCRPEPVARRDRAGHGRGQRRHAGVPVEFSESRFVASRDRVLDRQPDLAPSVSRVLN